MVPEGATLARSAPRFYKNIMKKLFAYASLIAVVLATACDKDEPKADPRSESINLLTASPWVIQTVEHSTDGDLTFQYSDFSIVFTKNASGNTDGDYVAANGGNAFPDTFGKWGLSDDRRMIVLSNGQELTVENLTSQSLVLNFVVAPPTGGRIAGVSGEFTFHLKH